MVVNSEMPKSEHNKVNNTDITTYLLSMCSTQGTFFLKGMHLLHTQS